MPLVADGSSNRGNSDLPVAEVKSQIFFGRLVHTELVGGIFGFSGRDVFHPNHHCRSHEEVTWL